MFWWVTECDQPLKPNVSFARDTTRQPSMYANCKHDQRRLSIDPLFQLSKLHNYSTFWPPAPGRWLMYSGPSLRSRAAWIAACSSGVKLAWNKWRQCRFSTADEVSNYLAQIERNTCPNAVSGIVHRLGNTKKNTQRSVPVIQRQTWETPALLKADECNWPRMRYFKLGCSLGAGSNKLWRMGEVRRFSHPMQTHQYWTSQHRSSRRDRRSKSSAIYSPWQQTLF